MNKKTYVSPKMIVVHIATTPILQMSIVGEAGGPIGVRGRNRDEWYYDDDEDLDY